VHCSTTLPETSITTCPPVTTDTTAVTFGDTNDNKTDSVLTGTITTPTNEATDPAITTTYTIKLTYILQLVVLLLVLHS